jgi:hypothetical protein
MGEADGEAAGSPAPGRTGEAPGQRAPQNVQRGRERVQDRLQVAGGDAPIEALRRPQHMVPAVTVIKRTGAVPDG